MKQPKAPELIDLIADALRIEIIDREAFQSLVNKIIIAHFAPRLLLTELENMKIISPKKASDDARGVREVTTK